MGKIIQFFVIIVSNCLTKSHYVWNRETTGYDNLKTLKLVWNSYASAGSKSAIQC